MLFLLRLVLLVAMLVTGLVLAFAESGWPDAEFWTRNDAWVDRSRIGLTVAGLTEPVRAAIASQVRRRRRKRAALVEDVLHFMLARIDKETTDVLKWHDIGIHVWEVRGRFVPSRFRHLSKVAKVRISNDDRGGSMIRWARGVGAIGKCWETGQGGVFDVTNLVPATLEEWERRAPAERMGLSWQQAQRTKGYGGIVVMPMYDLKDRFRGCVSVDGPKGTYNTLRNTRVQNITRDGANACAASLYERQ